MHAHASKRQETPPWQPPAGAQPAPIVSPSDLVNPMLRTGDLVTKSARVCDLKQPIIDAVGLLAECESGLLPVIDGDKPVGVLTERDVVRALTKAKTDFHQLVVEQVMVRRFPVVRDDATLDVLFETFGARGTLVVDRGGCLQGVIHWRNLALRLSERGLGRVLLKLIERDGKTDGGGKPT